MKSPQFDEAYVMEILASLRSGMTRAEFHEATRADWNAGYRKEVIQAESRYFAKGAK